MEKYVDKENKIVELRRLCLIDELPKNSESYFISRCIKLLRIHDKSLEVLISYADPYHKHNGVIYQATNFIYVGDTMKDKLYLSPTGKLYHSRALRTKYKGKLKPFAQKLNILLNENKLKIIEVPGKRCYIMPLNKRQNNKFRKLSLPYPKL